MLAELELRPPILLEIKFYPPMPDGVMEKVQVSHLKWVAIPQIHGDFTICMVMFGNGVLIGMATIRARWQSTPWDPQLEQKGFEEVGPG